MCFCYQKKFVECLVVSEKLSTFATANEKQTPLTPRQALISEAKKRKSSLKDLHKQINVVQEPVMLNGMTGVKKRTVKKSLGLLKNRLTVKSEP